MPDPSKAVTKATDAFLGRSVTVTLEIRGSDDGDRVRLGDFIEQLLALRDALRQTERIMYGTEGSVYYRIVELSQNSPATVGVEAVPATNRVDNAQPVVKRFFSYLDQLSAAETVPREMDLPALEAFRRLAPSKSRHVSELTVRNGSSAHRIDKLFAERVTRVIGPDKVSEGAITGALEVINLHNTPRFAIFSTLGDRKITCNFPPDMKQEVIAAIDKHVRVSGHVHYKTWDRHPHMVDVKNLVVFPNDDALPMLDDLAGVNPGIVGDMSPEEFVRAMRDAN